jgi:hypothetical protein
LTSDGGFLDKGLRGGSLDDLCDATGLSRSSLYATFGDNCGALRPDLGEIDG